MKKKLIFIQLVFIVFVNCVPDDAMFGFSAVVISLEGSSGVPLDSFDFKLLDSSSNELNLEV